MKFNIKISKTNIPNILTIFRIVLVPIIITLLLVQTTNVLYRINLWDLYFIDVSNLTFTAGILFIFASFSDFLDGFLARKWNVTSVFGKFWDPLADKILVNSILFCLASSNQNLIPIWIPIIVIIRDFIIDGIRLYMIKQCIVGQANIYGKIKTFLLLIAIIYLLFFGSNIDKVGVIYYWAIQNILIYLSIILVIVSGVIYSLPILKNRFFQK